ncbi:TPA: DUF596 domain-containing protein [Stenotrophomonas maltophilia]|uniref:DUF596 domain-containing protein n=1 Tax=Stenotrophomonas maltophilia TaxID=40324 RepID=UPI0013044B7B|nr:DUF596 domain-containing protein [Stenotrophomonas maltophilia]MBN5121966.1 DUF596 domain-containing protein [Stenotrophomonas maltophilia]MBO3004131.1 DUF596 domain-containing protein [Stenotrophomonas maltophilia]MBP1382671.1 DUF596 domain-containing protein [Stenotrophomonas maltophilia]MBP1387167.1 DUF596 domain-containing protein [Stenotrophomonas maltophilia]MCU1008508.1 DUF596 domain-containing protein [Stenotrophomonas maltophilia]
MTDAIRNVLHYSYGYSMGVLWRNMNMEVEGGDISFGQQTEEFFSMLRMLMEEGKLKLASDGVFADGDIDAQLGVLRHAWPAARDQEDLDEDGLWFLTDAPFGLVWITPEGDVWT